LPSRFRETSYGRRRRLRGGIRIKKESRKKP